MNKPIPIRKPPVKAIIRVNVWKAGCWTYHHGEKVTFKRLPEAREWATKNGYDGIKCQYE
jgi:hypothetical protein